VIRSESALRAAVVLGFLSPLAGADERLDALIARTSCGQPDQRCAAAREIGQLGAAGERAAPALAALLSDDDDQRVLYCAATAAGDVGAPALVPRLGQILEGSSPADREVRGAAADALVKMGPRAQAATAALHRALSDKDDYVRRMAAVALAGLEGRIWPVIRQLKEPRAHDEALWTLRKLGRSAVPSLTEALRSSDSDLRANAAVALGQIGPDAAPAVPELRRLARGDDDARASAISALGQIGVFSPDLVSDLLAQMRREDCMKHSDATLGNLLCEECPTPSQGSLVCLFAPDAVESLARTAAGNEVVPLLVAARSDRDLFVAAAAVRGLGAAGGVEALDALISALADPRPEIREVVVMVLGAKGETARRAVDAVTALFSDPGQPQEVHRAAREALDRIKAPDVVDGATAVPKLLRVLEDASLPSRERQTAATELGTYPAFAHETAPVLGRVLRQPVRPILERRDDKAEWNRSRLREAAAVALGRLGEDALPHLVSALGDPDQELRELASDALRNTSAPLTAEAIAALVTGLGEPWPPSRVGNYAVEALAKAGPPAVATVAAALGSKPAGDRAAEVLERIGAPAVPALVKVLQEGTALAREQVLYALRAMGPSASDAVPALTALVTDSNAPVDVRKSIPEVLAKIEGANASSVLLDATKSEQPAIRAQSATMLGSLCPLRADAALGLGRLLQDPAAAVRNASLRALVGARNGARPALPAILSALRDRSWSLERTDLIMALDTLDPGFEVLSTSVADDQDRCAAATLYLERLQRFAVDPARYPRQAAQVVRSIDGLVRAVQRSTACPEAATALRGRRARLVPASNSSSQR
jgi:HEAT repeat protein